MNGAFLRNNAAASAARGTGLVFSQLLALLSRGFLQRAGSQPLRGSMSHLLHLGQVHLETRPLLAKSPPNQYFPPLFRKLVDALQILGCPLPCCHGVAVLELREIRQG